MTLLPVERAVIVLALLCVEVEIVGQPGRKGDCPQGSAYSTQLGACVKPK